MKRNEQVYKLLKEINKKDLEIFIVRECERDPSFADRFLALGNGTVFPVNSSDYRGRVIKLIDRYSDRYGFINYDSSFAFNREMFDLLEEADHALADERWETAIAILTGIADASKDIIESGDDSAGNLGEIIDYCFERWMDLSLKDLPEKIRSTLFHHAMNQFKEKNLEEWDWWWNWIEIAINLAGSQEKRKQASDALDSIKAEEAPDWRRKYVNEKIITYKLKLIRLDGDEDHILRFMYENMSIPDIRKELLEHLWRSKEYDEILKVAENGVKTDQEWAGRVNEWLMWEFKVYRLTNNEEKTLKLARQFFLENPFFCQDGFSQDELYAIIKSLVPADKWADYVNGLLSESHHSRHDHSLYIYEKEKMWNGYIEFLKKHPSTHTIEHAPEEVKQQYKDILIDLYAKEVNKYFQIASGRNQYQSGVDLLKKLIMLGGKEKAVQIKTEQMHRTPRRPALIDELSKLNI